MKTEAFIRATRDWLEQFDTVPSSVINKMAQSDPAMFQYDSDSLRLISSPDIECQNCGEIQDNLSAIDLDKTWEHGKNIACQHCHANDDLIFRLPDVFPCSWGWLWAPPHEDQTWFLTNKHLVSKLGLYVFESEDYGVLLGIDAGGFDFHEAYWAPLYELRGLQWHVHNP
jgi:hypothetical protein